MNLFRKYKPEDGFARLIQPGDMGLRLIDFGMLNLKDGRVFNEDTGQTEVVLVILSGRCDIASAGKVWPSVGARENVFEGRPYSVYIPSHSEYTVTGSAAVEIAVCKAPADSKRKARLITPEDTQVLSRGRDNWYRDVCEIARLKKDTESLIVGETISGPGNWCSYPPHKHDLEEAYFFKVNPPQGFGIQRIYTDDRKLDELYAIEHNSMAAIPKGYHPLVAAPGYSIWFLYVLAAGQNQVLEAHNDPAHNWLDNAKKE